MATDLRTLNPDLDLKVMIMMRFGLLMVVSLAFPFRGTAWCWRRNGAIGAELDGPMASMCLEH